MTETHRHAEHHPDQLADGSAAENGKGGDGETRVKVHGTRARDREEGKGAAGSDSTAVLALVVRTVSGAVWNAQPSFLWAGCATFSGRLRTDPVCAVPDRLIRPLTLFRSERNTRSTGDTLCESNCVEALGASVSTLGAFWLQTDENQRPLGRPAQQCAFHSRRGVVRSRS
jgi:hypothetical protein